MNLKVSSRISLTLEFLCKNDLFFPCGRNKLVFNYLQGDDFELCLSTNLLLPQTLGIFPPNFTLKLYLNTCHKFMKPLVSFSDFDDLTNQQSTHFLPKKNPSFRDVFYDMIKTILSVFISLAFQCCFFLSNSFQQSVIFPL